jgi:hypothetical protein
MLTYVESITTTRGQTVLGEKFSPHFKPGWQGLRLLEKSEAVCQKYCGLYTVTLGYCYSQASSPATSNTDVLSREISTKAKALSVPLRKENNFSKPISAVCVRALSSTTVS